MTAADPMSRAAERIAVDYPVEILAMPESGAALAMPAGGDADRAGPVRRRDGGLVPVSDDGTTLAAATTAAELDSTSGGHMATTPAETPAAAVDTGGPAALAVEPPDDGAPEPVPEVEPGDEPDEDPPPEHTGAMIALIPSDADAARLAVDGGEPVDELHATLLYLGEAADIPEPVRAALVAQVRDAVNGWPVVDADAFSVSLFNPGTANDAEPCIVVLLSGEDLDVIHGLVEDVVVDVVDAFDETDETDVDNVTWEPPAQHQPWHAYTTLRYLGDQPQDLGGLVAGLTDRMGPVRFDRVRVVFAGEATDIPLSEVPAVPDTVGEPQPGGLDGGEVVAASASAGAVAAWESLAGQMPENLKRHWLRKLAPWGRGSFRRCVRALRRYFPKDPEGLCANLHKEATGRWPGQNHSTMEATIMSVDTSTDAGTSPFPPKDECPDGERYDPDQGKCVPEGDESFAAEPVVPVGDPVDPVECPDGEHHDPDTGGCVPDQLTPTDEHFHAIMHVEGVTTGLRTFEPGSLTWRDPPFAFHWQVKSSAHGGTPETVHVGNIVRVVRDGNTLHGWGRLDLGCPEGVEYARRLIEGFARWSSIGLDEYPTDVELVWPEGEGGDDDGDEVGLLFAEPEQMIFHAGRIGELTAVSTPAQDAAVIDPLPALTEALTALGVTVTAPASEPAPALVAAGYTITIPDCPPPEWFDEPSDVIPHGALTITDEGRIYGYLAPAEIAHRSFRDRRVTAPMGRVDYTRWMGGEALVAGGRVVAGPITMECGHLPPTASAHPVIRMDHYENSCSVVAKARVGENRHGVWIAGALEPGVSAEQVSRMLACRLSGDWAPHPERQGWQELCAALLVPVPGFPMARSAPSVRVTDGALVASSVPVRIVAADTDLTVGPDLRPVLERVARSIGRDAPTRLEALRGRVHAERG